MSAAALASRSAAASSAPDVVTAPPSAAAPAAQSSSSASSSRPGAAPAGVALPRRRVCVGPCGPRRGLASAACRRRGGSLVYTVRGLMWKRPCPCMIECPRAHCQEAEPEAEAAEAEAAAGGTCGPAQGRQCGHGGRTHGEERPGRASGGGSPTAQQQRGFRPAGLPGRRAVRDERDDEEDEESGWSSAAPLQSGIKSRWSLCPRRTGSPPRRRCRRAAPRPGSPGRASGPGSR